MRPAAELFLDDAIHASHLRRFAIELPLDEAIHASHLRRFAIASLADC